MSPPVVDDVSSAFAERDSGDEVIFALRSSGPASRAELAARLGISRTHIGRVVADLARAGLVVDFVATPRERRTVGRPGQVMALRPGLGYAVGVNITATEVRCLVTDLSHRWVTSSSDPLDSPDDLDSALDTVVTCIERINRRVGADHGQCLGVGIALPVPIDERTQRATRSSPTEIWEDAPVAEVLRRRLGVDVHVGNHGQLAVGAELLWGVGRRAVTTLLDFLANSPAAADLLLAERGIPANQTNRDRVADRLSASDRKSVAYLEAIQPELGAAPPLQPIGGGDFPNVLARINQEVVFERLSPQDAADRLIAEVQSTLQ